MRKMVPKIVKNPPAPGTPEWRKIVTASKVPGLLGISRFTSQFTVWNEMAGRVEPEPFPEDLWAWGHIAESSLAEWWKYKNPGWLLNSPRAGGKTEIAYTDPAIPFPNLVTLDRRALNRKAGGPSSSERFWIVECKTAHALDSWGRPGVPDSVPRDYYTQVLYQMGVSGIHRASIVVLGPFGQPEIHEVLWDEDRFMRLVQKLERLYQSIRRGVPPELDESVSTYETVRGLHPEINRGEEVQTDIARAVNWLDAVMAADAADAAARMAKTEIADLMGNAQYLKVGDVKIAHRSARGQGKPFVQINKKADLGG